jgi:hypothetical protein
VKGLSGDDFEILDDVVGYKPGRRALRRRLKADTTYADPQDYLVSAGKPDASGADLA